MLATLIVRECATLAGDILSMHACGRCSIQINVILHMPLCIPCMHECMLDAAIACIYTRVDAFLIYLVIKQILEH